MNVDRFSDCILCPSMSSHISYHLDFRSVCNTIRMISCCILSDLQAYKFSPNQPFTDPAIMSVSSLMPHQQQSNHNANFATSPVPMGNFSPGPGPFGPPGLAYPPGIFSLPHAGGRQVQGGPPSGLDISQASGSAHGESNFSFYQRQSQVRVPSGGLSARKLYHPRP